MLNNNKFYFATIRNAIIAFGALFNNIQIDRPDANGNVVQTLKIPLTYSSKNKALARIRAQPDLENRPFQLSMPIMGFQITGFDYDPDRKLPVLNQARKVQGTTARTQYSPAPFDMHLQLHILSKNQEDALRIVEQIFPYFNPAYVVTLNDVPELDIKRDVPVVLNAVNYEDDFEGKVEDTRTIVWSFSFTMKLNFYGAISDTAVIKHVTINTIVEDDEHPASETYKVSVNPATAKETDSWTFLEEFTGHY